MGHFNYWIVIYLMMAGFYIMIVQGNLVKKIVGLNIFQASIFIMFISMGKVEDGTAPDPCRRHDLLFQPPSPRSDTDRHRGRGGYNGPRPCPSCAY